MKKLLIVNLLFLLVSACHVPRIPLSEEEKELETRLRNSFNCEDLELRHDYEAITENQTEGKFWVGINNSNPDLCKLDSMAIKELAIALTDSLLSVLTHRKNYKSVNFHFSFNEHIDARMDRQVCYKGINVYLDSARTTEFEFYAEHY